MNINPHLTIYLCMLLSSSYTEGPKDLDHWRLKSNYVAGKDFSKAKCTMPSYQVRSTVYSSLQ